ncbi:MAG: undecaprenyl/decaprenyl-phosphate alpha-N-acetylglucosaminyl 1-phosphate transferase, partial [Chloroflexi bacterium]
DLPALPRLGVHIIAALVAVGPYLWDHTLYPDALGQPTEARGIILTAFNFPFVYQIHLHNLSPWLAIVATVFWIVGMQNMVNWLDGLDGLAAGVTLIAGVVLALHTLTLEPPQMTVALLPLALSGVCAAFLLYNSHPARIFMGDVGAMTIGYTLGICALIGGAKLATVLLVLGVPLVDMAWLILTRTLRGRSAAQAGRDHLHHRLLDLGLSQRQVVAGYYGLSIAFGAIGLIDFFTPLMKLIALVLLGLVVLVILIVLQSKPTTHAARL